MSLRALPVPAVLALVLGATQLGGCVAAAALAPLAAGGAMAGRSVGNRQAKPEEAKAAAAKPARAEVTLGQGVAVPPPMQAPAAPVDAPASAEAAAAPALPAEALEAGEDGPSIDEARVKPLGEGAEDLPPPATAIPRPPAAVQASDYTAFAAFALARAQASGTAAGVVRKSVLVDQRSLAAIPVLRNCDRQRGAVLIDLDVGTDPFDLDDPPSPAEGLADHLRAIRATGVAVLWIASLPESEAKRLGTILKATGLDPLGIDPVALLRPRETRKQQILDRLDRDWCVLAIAGDRKADFDEVFDYLRNPEGPVALALEQHIGAGWFLVPPPIR